MLVLTLQEQIAVLVEAKKIYKYSKLSYMGVGTTRPLGLCYAIVTAIWRLHNVRTCNVAISNIIPIFNNTAATIVANANESDSYAYWWPVFITETNCNWQNDPERFKPSYYAKQLRNAKPRLEFLDWCITQIEGDIVYKEKLDKLYKEMHQYL